MNPIAASEQLCASGNRFLHLRIQAEQNCFGRKRTDFGRLIERVADLERAHSFDKFLQKIIVDFVRDDETFRRDARLARIDRARFHSDGECLVHIRTGHHDERIASAELEHALLDFARGDTGDGAARAIAARERHRFHSWIDN